MNENDVLRRAGGQMNLVLHPVNMSVKTVTWEMTRA